jgi:uncharacterized protein (TIGR02246 family)
MEAPSCPEHAIFPALSSFSWDFLEIGLRAEPSSDMLKASRNGCLHFGANSLRVSSNKGQIRMDSLERLVIERDCERLVTEYCHLVDHNEAEGIAELFTEDGVWKSVEATLDGREQIRKAMAERQANTRRMSRHVCNNFSLKILDADHAEGIVYLTLYRHDGKEGRRLSPLEGPAMVGEYRDRFVRTSQGWQIAHREIAVDFLRRETSAP